MPPVVHTGPRLVIAFAGRSATSLRSLYSWPYHYFLEGAPFYWSYPLFCWMRGSPSRLLRFLPVNQKGTAQAWREQCGQLRADIRRKIRSAMLQNVLESFFQRPLVNRLLGGRRRRGRDHFRRRRRRLRFPACFLSPG